MLRISYSDVVIEWNWILKREHCHSAIQKSVDAYELSPISNNSSDVPVKSVSVNTGHVVDESEADISMPILTPQDYGLTNQIINYTGI